MNKVTNKCSIPGIIHEYRKGSGVTGSILGYFYGETAKGEVRLLQINIQILFYYLRQEKLIENSEFEAAVVLEPQAIESQVDQNGQLKASNNFECVLKNDQNETAEAFICYNKVQEEDGEVTLEFYFCQYTNMNKIITLDQEVACINQEFDIEDQWSTWSGIWQTVKPDVIKSGVGMMTLLVMIFFYLHPDAFDELIKWNQRIEFVSRSLPNND
ncbi:hypothetical protein IPH67_04060 [bacterium]|nr:MAG: hypothetical protein IPH67_04060 [bacterium]